MTWGRLCVGEKSTDAVPPTSHNENYGSNVPPPIVGSVGFDP